MDGGVEERLARLEELLRRLEERLVRLEGILRGYSDLAAEAVRLAVLGNLPAIAAVEAARRLLAVARLAEGDPVAEAVLEAMSNCEWLSVSEIARRVRRIRGSASRETIRRRLRLLLEKGAVVARGEGVKRRYRLASCGQG